MAATIELALAGLLLGWTGAVTLVSGVAVGRALWRRRAARRVATPASRADEPGVPRTALRVVVVRPCAGLEPHLRRCLESTAALHHDGPLRVVLSTSTVDDPARPVLLEVAASLRARGMDVAVHAITPRDLHLNLKASQLAGALDASGEAAVLEGAAGADVALVIDSDVELEALELPRLLAPLRDPAPPGGASCSPGSRPKTARVSAVWCPAVERAPASLGDRMSAALLGGSLHAFPLLGTLDPHGLVGKAFAVRLDALHDVGGFGGLVRHLGEDMELARRLRARGLGVTMSDVVVASLASRRSVAQVLARYTRWLLVIRAQRPWLLASYPLLLAATPLLVLGGSLGLLGGVPGAGVAVGTAVVVRLVVGGVAAMISRRDPRPAALLLDAVLADVLLLAAFVCALGPARVRWRDRVLRLGTHGVLEPHPAVQHGPLAIERAPRSVPRRPVVELPGKGTSADRPEDARA